jgi:hypothetical protein
LKPRLVYPWNDDDDDDDDEHVSDSFVLNAGMSSGVRKTRLTEADIRLAYLKAKKLFEERIARVTPEHA